MWSIYYTPFIFQYLCVYDKVENIKYPASLTE